MLVIYIDLTSSHYANETTQWLLRQKTIFELNPANARQARPIEDFWSILADKVDEGDWKAKTELQLKRRISSEDQTN